MIQVSGLTHFVVEVIQYVLVLCTIILVCLVLYMMGVWMIGYFS